ncbi:hypothetical protein B484DRAFT_404800 [Ochromonadaceae sp. CCMP2298]|nr:hypothetical protein B484DRAFT_404800 [Ochromonadaceae sp. CCMP2298]
MDANRDMAITYEEMQAWFNTMHPDKLTAIPAGLFEREDKYQDGVISFDRTCWNDCAQPDWGSKTAANLLLRELDVQLRTYPRTAHGTSPQQLAELLLWIKDVLQVHKCQPEKCQPKMGASAGLLLEWGGLRMWDRGQGAGGRGQGAASVAIRGQAAGMHIPYAIDELDENLGAKGKTSAAPRVRVRYAVPQEL